MREIDCRRFAFEEEDGGGDSVRENLFHDREYERSHARTPGRFFVRVTARRRKIVHRLPRGLGKVSCLWRDVKLIHVVAKLTSLCALVQSSRFL